MIPMITVSAPLATSVTRVPRFISSAAGFSPPGASQQARITRK